MTNKSLLALPISYQLAHKIPCKDCKERHLYCHSECEKYTEYKNQLEARKEEIKPVILMRSEIIGHKKDVIAKTIKKYR